MGPGLRGATQGGVRSGFCPLTPRSTAGGGGWRACLPGSSDGKRVKNKVVWGLSFYSFSRTLRLAYGSPQNLEGSQERQAEKEMGEETLVLSAAVTSGPPGRDGGAGGREKWDRCELLQAGCAAVDGSAREPQPPPKISGP